jgi:hypothetical protein
LATIRVLGRERNLAPLSVSHPLKARFGESMGLVDYDLQTSGNQLHLTLHWQALAPMTSRYKVFVHLVGDGGASDIRAQVDAWPHLTTTSWVPGEYLSDDLLLNLPEDLTRAAYTLLVGVYHEATGTRLPITDPSGAALGDSLTLTEIQTGQ